jgi:hypothetical protein
MHKYINTVARPQLEKSSSGKPKKEQHRSGSALGSIPASNCKLKPVTAKETKQNRWGSSKNELETIPMITQ